MHNLCKRFIIEIEDSGKLYAYLNYVAKCGGEKLVSSVFCSELGDEAIVNTYAEFRVTAESVYDVQVERSNPIGHAWRMIARDHEQVFGKAPVQGQQLL